MAELVSTRDPDAERVSYTEAVIQGLAPDKGLYVPEGAVYPRISEEELTQLLSETYAGVATFVKSKLIGGDIPLADQLAINEVAYDPAAFPGSVDGNIAPVKEVAENLFIQNLALGPTAAFKDFGMRSLAGEVAYLLDIQDEDMDILGATSGDTGSAAERAFKDAAGNRSRRIGMFMLSPLNGTMTPFQRAQMGVESNGYTHNLSYDGSFDDCQTLVKAVKQDPEFSDLGAVNSINWGRITAQVAYPVWAYLQMVRDGHIKMGDLINFLTPTGNGGNTYSNHVAKDMGLPIGHSSMATNENNVMHRLVQTGLYEKADKPFDTSSPSMDITTASNYERLVYEFFEGDAGRTRAYMQEFEREGRVSLQDHGLGPQVFEKFGIGSGSSTHADRLESIREVYRSSYDVIDPHTADAVTVALRGDLEIPTICLGTAAPVKFEDTVREALGFVPQREERFEGLEDRPGADNFVVIKSVDALKAYIRKHRHPPAA